MANQQLTIVARILAKPEKRELVKSELIKLIAPTREEEGCVNYDLHQDNENENLFLFFENWTTRELWQKHMENPHIAAYMEATEGAVADFSLHEMTRIG
ncbi:putative quinol monooxygenase [Flagellimonas myxillae]|uniref:putative quinol monooxygenase n=1 Tax=Flagellimonas myxillae TaxID=2942214 RepID=UPI00201E8A8A|nr:putative quinol monooxygenase [Muricauda myxillae]MCL6267020.1 antibiotic biosynthesis monooxygenase [Muricauda myxillae]